MENLDAYDKTTLSLQQEHEERFLKAAWIGWMQGTALFWFLTTYQLMVYPVPYETSIHMLKFYSGIGSITLYVAHALDINNKIRKIFCLLGFTALTAMVGAFLPASYHGVVEIVSLLLVSMTLWFLSHSHAKIMAMRQANRPRI